VIARVARWAVTAPTSHRGPLPFASFMPPREHKAAGGPAATVSCGCADAELSRLVGVRGKNPWDL